MAYSTPVTTGRSRRYIGVNLFIKNLDHSFDTKALKDAFSKYGNIISCKVQLDEMGNSKGFGFVCYTKASEASLAIAEMNGRIFGSKPLYVNIFEPKEERQHHYAEKLAERSEFSDAAEYCELPRRHGRSRGRWPVPTSTTMLQAPASAAMQFANFPRGTQAPMLLPSAYAATANSGGYGRATGVANFPRAPNVGMTAGHQVTNAAMMAEFAKNSQAYWANAQEMTGAARLDYLRNVTGPYLVASVRNTDQYVGPSRDGTVNDVPHLLFGGRTSAANGRPQNGGW